MSFDAVQSRRDPATGAEQDRYVGPEVNRKRSITLAEARAHCQFGIKASRAGVRSGVLIVGGDNGAATYTPPQAKIYCASIGRQACYIE